MNSHTGNAKTSNQNIFFCKICYSEFDSVDLKPYTLSPCGHTLCIECLKEIEEQFGECPFCKTQINSYSLNNKLKELLEDKKDSLNCSDCGGIVGSIYLEWKSLEENEKSGNQDSNPISSSSNIKIKCKQCFSGSSRSINQLEDYSSFASSNYTIKKTSLKDFITEYKNKINNTHDTNNTIKINSTILQSIKSTMKSNILKLLELEIDSILDSSSTAFSSVFSTIESNIKNKYFASGIDKSILSIENLIKSKNKILEELNITNNSLNNNLNNNILINQIQEVLEFSNTSNINTVKNIVEKEIQENKQIFSIEYTKEVKTRLENMNFDKILKNLVAGNINSNSNSNLKFNVEASGYIPKYNSNSKNLGGGSCSGGSVGSSSGYNGNKTNSTSNNSNASSKNINSSNNIGNSNGNNSNSSSIPSSCLNSQPFNPNITYYQNNTFHLYNNNPNINNMTNPMINLTPTWNTNQMNIHMNNINNHMNMNTNISNNQNPNLNSTINPINSTSNPISHLTKIPSNTSTTSLTTTTNLISKTEDVRSPYEAQIIGLRVGIHEISKLESILNSQYKCRSRINIKDDEYYHTRLMFNNEIEFNSFMQNPQKMTLDEHTISLSKKQKKEGNRVYVKYLTAINKMSTLIMNVIPTTTNSSSKNNNNSNTSTINSLVMSHNDSNNSNN